jgi:hypothetical protein
MASTARRAATLAALALIAVLLGGCAVFRVTPAALQAGTIGDVTVHLDVCASGISTCPSNGDSDADTSANKYDLQLLLGILVPDGADAPASFDTSTGPIGTFARNTSYSSGLQLISPAPAGFHWIGYAATAVYHWDYAANPATAFTADPTFHLRPASDGSPFRGPFKYRAVVGIKAIDGSQPLGSPFDCVGNRLQTQTYCTDKSPGADPIGTDLSLPTRDLGVVTAGAPASTTPGGAVSVPFTLRYAGTATQAATFALSAASTVPGAAAPTLSTQSVAPSTDSDSNVLATVNIPAGTAPGDYTATLTAALPNGQTRTGTSTVKVLPPGGSVNDPPPGDSADKRAPAATVSIKAEKLQRLIKTRKLSLRVGEDEAGSVALTAKIGGRSASVKIGFAKPGSRTATLKIGKSAAKALSGHSRVKLTVKATARDLAGNTTVVRAHRTLKR